MSQAHEQPPPSRHLTGAIVPALAAAGLAALGALFIVGHQGSASNAGPAGCAMNVNMGGPFVLVDGNGAAVTQASFARGPAIVYFGFTHCPDVCPTTLYALGEALQQSRVNDIQPIFVTLDPTRDTPGVMRDYVKTGGFPTGLVGLTGSEAQVRAAAEAFNVSYRKAPIEGADASAYNIDHTSLLYVMDEHWRARAVMASNGQTPQTIAACIAAGLSRTD